MMKNGEHSRSTLRIISKSDSSQLLSGLLESVKDIQDQIKRSSKQKNHQMTEDRFDSVEMDTPDIKHLIGQKKKGELEEWLGRLTRTVFSKGFSFYQNQRLTFKQTKAFCSENLLFNLVRMIRVNQLNDGEIKFMDQVLKKMMESMIYTYPKSESAETNLRLANLIRKIDNYDSYENDLIAKSKVKLEYAEDGDYSKPIMQVLNFIIELVDKKVIEKEEQGAQIELSQCFQKDMNSLFRMVQDQKAVKKKIAFDYKTKERENKEREEKELKGLIQGQPAIKPECNKEGEEDEAAFSEKRRKIVYSPQEYAKKVKEYTVSQIGRKLSKNTKPFFPREIESGIVEVRNTKILRIITKWCQELEDAFESSKLCDRNEPFRTVNGFQEFYTPGELKELSRILDEEKKNVVKQAKKEIEKNNYQQQEKVSTSELEKEWRYLSPSESCVGFFSSIMLKNNKQYILTYLNVLIHGLLSASKKFVQQNFNHIEVEEKRAKKCPQLITFRIGDLLRCKCTSRQTEILALYNELERISLDYPKTLKIVKIKNKLDTETRNILINLMYRQKLLVEIQLGIDDKKSKFLECSNEFNHFVYELQRAKFGVLGQLCNIWMDTDPRAGLYEQHQKDLKFKQNKPQRHNCDAKLEKKVNLPFKCGSCRQLFNKVNLSENHAYCQKCKLVICIHCQLYPAKTYEQVRQLFPRLPGEVEAWKVEKYEDIPQNGLIFKLEEKNKKVRQFWQVKEKKEEEKEEKKREEEEKLLLVIEDMEEKKEEGVYKTHKLDKKSIQKLFRNNVLFRVDDPFSGEKRQEKHTKLKRQYFVPKKIKEAEDEHKECLCLQSQTLDDEALKKAKGEVSKFFYVKSINLTDNSITDFELFVDWFWKMETLILNYNKIKQMPKDYMKMLILKRLELEGNQIKYVEESIGQLRQLKVLNLNLNKDLNKLSPEICDCSELSELYLNGTALESLPNMQKLQKLRALEASSCQITTIEGSFPSSLRVLDLSKNKFKDFPQKLFQIKGLLFLVFNDNHIKIPDDFADMEELKELYLHHNKLETLKSVLQLPKLSLLTINQGMNIVKEGLKVKPL